MPVYERVDDSGQVVERVDPVPGDYEDTRLGLAVLEGHGGWRIAGAAPPPVDHAAAHAGEAGAAGAEPAAAEPAQDPAPVSPQPAAAEQPTGPTSARKRKGG